jgi:hypothetical protein
MDNDNELIKYKRIHTRRSKIIAILDELERGNVPHDFAECLMDGPYLGAGFDWYCVSPDIHSYWWDGEIRMGTRRGTPVDVATISGRGRDRKRRHINAVIPVEAGERFRDLQSRLLDKGISEEDYSFALSIDSLLCVGRMAMGRGQERAARAVLQATVARIESWVPGEHSPPHVRVE